jgi:hypothetical protein
VLIGVERLLIRLRHPASRADELNALRGRLRAEIARVPDEDDRARALRVLALKRSISDALNEVSSCRSCATGLPAPHGSYAGGACCAGVTAQLFDERELTALALAGTRPSDLTPPAGADLHAGCAFRGPRGCTLDVAHRPARCVLYVCETLTRELHRAGQLDDIERMLAELRREATELFAALSARADRDVLAPLVAALEAFRQGPA